MRRATTEPWKCWIPGVLSRNQVLALIQEEVLIGSIREESVDASSLDLSLSSDGYELVSGSIKPTAGVKKTYLKFIQGQYSKKLTPASDGTFLLRKQTTYVFRLNEKLGRKILDGQIFGQATAKSSVGRLDVLVRLIVDGMDTYEGFQPSCMERGDGGMYIEITPMTFDVMVKEGCSLSQLRLCYGDFESAIMRSKLLNATVGADDGCLTVDLENVEIGGLKASAFSVSPRRDETAIALWDGAPRQDPWKYWTLIRSGADQRLKIEQSNFYIFRSKERINVPAGIAIYCKASDETIGEMRIHYAGFVHPFFGGMRKDGEMGTPLIFEVRGHQVDVSLADGERLANLIFYRMSEDAAPGLESDYEQQSLKLSKFFADWPNKLREMDNGTVEPA